MPYIINPFTGKLTPIGGGGSSQWTTSGDDIYNNNTGGVGVGQKTPLAQLHVSPTISNPSNFNSTINIGSAGYVLGSGNKDYSLYGENSSIPVFSNPFPLTFVEPPSANFDPSGGTASFNTGGAGYIASGYDFSYTWWALYNGNTQIGNGNATTSDTGSDPNDGSSYTVDVLTTAPIGATPSGYLVQCNGSNPNTGLYQIVGSISFSDSGTGWTSSPGSFSPLTYSVGLGWTVGAAPTDSYTVSNNTNDSYIVLGNSGGTTDDGTWIIGSAVIIPTGESKSMIVEGALEDHNGISYSMPSSLPIVVGFLSVDNAGNQNWGPIDAGNISVTDNQLLYGAGGVISQSSRLTFDGTSLKIGAVSNNTIDFGITKNIDFGSTGTQNNYGTTSISHLAMGNAITFTGFSGGYNGKILIVSNASGNTYKNANGGSLSVNQILTPNGGDYTPSLVNTSTIWLYDGNADIWWCLNPDYTQIASTWSKPQNIPGLVGVTTNSNAAAGQIGEYITSNVPNSNSTVTVSIATPAVITWTGNPLNNFSPVVFTTTGALPTGITAGTVYWTCNVSGNTFNIATSIANAVANTRVATTGTQSGTHTITSGSPLSTTTDASVTALRLTAGDWDVEGNVAFTAGTLTTATIYTGSIGTTNNSVGTSPNSGAFAQFGLSVGAAGQEPTFPVGRRRVSISTTTTVYLVANSTFATSTMTSYGFIGARRAR